MLESLVNGVNIKDLVISPPKERVNPLGADLDLITNEDWQQLVLTLDNRWDIAMPPGKGVLKMAAALKIATPKRFASLNFEGIDQMFTELSNQVIGYRDYLKGVQSGVDIDGELAEYSKCLRILYPERFDELGLETEGFDFIKEAFKIEDWYPIADALIAFPGQRDQIHLADGEADSRLLEIKGVYKNNIPRALYLAKSFRILFPERFPEVWGVDLDKNTVTKFIEEKKLEPKSWWQYSFDLEAAKILLADEVEVTPQGLRIVMYEDQKFIEDEFDLPIRRNF